MSGTNEISEIFEGLINDRNADNRFPYYLLIARFVTQGNRMAYRAFLNLPTENLGPCNTPLFRDAVNAELFQSALNPVDLESGLSASLSTDLIKKCYKIIDRLNCCAYSRELEENCSFCMLTQEEVIAKLKGERYFDFEEVLSITSSGTYKVELQDKVYPNLDFSKNIIYKNGTELYSLSDVLDQLMADIDNYYVSIDLYDDSPATEQFLCYEELSEHSSFRSNQEGLTSHIKVINYQQKPRVLLKFNFVWQGNRVEPLPVYLYDITDKFSSTDKKIEHFEKRIQIMTNHCNLIYDKNNYNGLFSYSLIENDSQLNNLVMDEGNSLFNLRNRPNYGPLGRTYFESQGSTDLRLQKYYPFSEYDNYTKGYRDLDFGNFINFGRHPGPTSYYHRAGYSLAHELLHVLTGRGARIINLPASYFCDYGRIDQYLQNCVHYDEVDNLLADGIKWGGDPPESDPDYLYEKETIVPQVNYLVVQYLVWYYWRKNR
ncbi:MAG TPA: hypothetical protein PLU49_03300 [Saprospiraceae bacterium]|nr:hypothetical protein [Saprospirales bacterium]HRQ29074.1 hypothetical protein [Saprospiraceae bacterium]